MIFKRLVFGMWVALTAVVTVGQSIAPIEAWTVDLSKKEKSRSIEIKRGSSRHIRPTVVDGSTAWVFPTNAEVVMRYKTDAMTNTYHSVTGGVHSATGGVLNVLWTPAQEGESDAYSFEIEAATGTTAQISISGTIFLKDSLATLATTTNPSAMTRLDWLLITNVNASSAPWGSGSGNDGAARAMATTNAASITNEAAIRLAGDVAGSNNVTTQIGLLTNTYVRITNISAGVWGFLLPGE